MSQRRRDPFSWRWINYCTCMEIKEEGSTNKVRNGKRWSSWRVLPSSQGLVFKGLYYLICTSKLKSVTECFLFCALWLI